MFNLCDFLPRFCLLGSFVTFRGVLAHVYLEKINKEMSCSNVNNQQVCLPDPDRVASETKIKDPKHVETACKGRQNYMKKLKDRILKDNQIVQVTLK